MLGAKHISLISLLALSLSAPAIAAPNSNAVISNTAVATTNAKASHNNSEKAKNLFTEAKGYHDGTKGAKDLTKALALYEQAAKLGNNDARVNLGFMYFTGEGVPQDYKIAGHWYLLAGHDGDRDAQRNLAMMFERGLGLPQDQNLAKAWYEQSARPVLKPKPALALRKPAKPEPMKYASAIEKNPKSPTELMAAIDPVATVELKRASKTASVSLAGAANVKVPAVPAKIKKPAAEQTPVKVAATPLVIAQPKPKLVLGSTAQTGTSLEKKAVPFEAPTTAAGYAAVHNATSNGPAPVATINERNYDARMIAPLWSGKAVPLILFLIAGGSLGWYLLQYWRLRNGYSSHKFADDFFTENREHIRSTFLRYPIDQRSTKSIDDPWSVAMSVLMVKFATARAASGMNCYFSKRIVKLMGVNSILARRAVFPLVASLQKRLLADIACHERNKPQTEAPLQFSQEDRPVAPELKLATTPPPLMESHSLRSKLGFNPQFS